MENSFIHYGFLRSFTDYLIQSENDTAAGEYADRRNAFYKSVSQKWDVLCGEKTVEGLNRLTEYIGASEFVHKSHYEGFKWLREALFGLADLDIYRLYALLFETDTGWDLSSPVQKILFDRFPAIVDHVIRKTDVPPVFGEAADVKRFRDALYVALAEFAALECPEKSLFVWGQNYPVDPPRTDPSRESVGGDDFQNLCCYVELADAETVSRMKQASFLAAYRIDGPERSIMQIGSFITFALPDLSDAVTVQITGCFEYDARKKMVKDIITGTFGYPEMEPFEYAKKLYADRSSGEPLCLKVKRLSLPILKVRDFETLRKKGRRHLYCEDDTGRAYSIYPETEPTLITDCCSLEVGNYYRFCPNCGKKIDIIHCKRGVAVKGFDAWLRDETLWICSCGGHERFRYSYCPLCGKKRTPEKPVSDGKLPFEDFVLPVFRDKEQDPDE